MPYTITELVEDVAEGQSPSSVSISFQQSSSSRIWRAISSKNGDGSQNFDIQPSDFYQLIHDILGTTSYPVNGNAPGKLNRALPLLDPQIPNLYASEIQSLRGFGSYQLVGPQNTTDSNNYQGFALWSNYDITVASVGRPYPVAADAQINFKVSKWTDISGAAQSTGYYPEYERFCDFTIQPKAEWLEQQRGASYFQTSDNSEPGNGLTTQQSVRMLMPDSILKVLWIGVPLRYVLSTNSYLNKFRGRINQNAWAGSAGTGTSFPAGSLLYWDYQPRIYLPPAPVTYSWAGAFLDFTRLCDIELTFMYTTRNITLAPTTSNANFVPAGWNALPYLPQRKFYYAYNTDLAGTTKYPQFYSFPVEILFSDPDDPNAYKGTG